MAQADCRRLSGHWARDSAELVAAGKDNSARAAFTRAHAILRGAGVGAQLMGKGKHL